MDDINPEERPKEKIELEKVAESIRDQLIAYDYQFLFLIQGQKGMVLSCEMADWAVLNLIKSFFKDKRYGITFWKKLYLLFG